ncbi:MAG TPA: alpha/beta fold hydrolase, partial [Cryptosporangiaceae bacterium]|nr:alpha/beta fold hydrolase [Cryptosporangiaceae bacterium]
MGSLPGRVARAVLVLMGVLVLMLAAIWGLQRRMIYLPSGGPVPPAAEAIDGAKSVTLTTADGLDLGAWFVPARRADRGVVVLVAPGNGGDRSLRAPLADALADRGVGVLLFDYRGYGGNPGSPSEEGLARDVRAAHRYLVETLGVPQRRLLYFGESLGCGVVTELATEHPPGGCTTRTCRSGRCCWTGIRSPTSCARCRCPRPW